MEKIYYDFHIHSCLSPCADNDMTPNDIVNMAVLNGLDMIAVTDHNSFRNAPAVTAAAESAGLLLLYGSEVETSEEVHVLCLFATLPEALSFEEKLKPFFANIKNRTDIYGDQLVMDENDQVIDCEERMLVTATLLSFDDLFPMVISHGGAFVPAHIDKSAYSVLSNMGFIPDYLAIKTVEISPNGLQNGFMEQNETLLKNFKIITSSDAHYLWDIAERRNSLEVAEKSPRAVIDFLSGKN